MCFFYDGVFLFQRHFERKKKDDRVNNHCINYNSDCFSHGPFQLMLMTCYGWVGDAG